MDERFGFFSQCRANASKPATSHCRARLCLLQSCFIMQSWHAARWARLELRPSLHCLSVCSGYFEQVSHVILIGCSKLKHLQLPPFSGYCPPDTWHYDTAAGSLELQRFCQSLHFKLLCYSLSTSTLSLSCCYPSLSCNIQHIPQVLGVMFGLESFFVSKSDWSFFPHII